ncbi:GerAB/ArcD/ProY family transporter [Paenibacillus sp. FSL L8-0696]|uniref:GerAB/ArcD/ProY family transporter n=1 Tax=Paenibacillus sp. FSL L8-0696 TaxID=2954524 RepID=UPI00311A3021
MRTTKWQLFRFITIFFSSQTTIFLIPAIIATSSYQGWIALIVGSLLGLILLWFTIYVGKLRPNQAWVHFGKEIIGKWPHKFMILLLLCWCVYYVSFDIENFVLFFGSNYLRGTPPLFIQCVVGLVIMYTASLGFATITYMADGLFIIFFITVIILFNLFLPNADFNMVPAFFHYHDPGIALKDSIVVMSWFGEWIVLLFIAPDLKIEAKMMKRLVFAQFYVSITVLIGWLLTMMSFGPHLGQQLQYPFLEMVRSSKEDNLLGNTDPLLIGIWSSSMFIHSSFLIYIASKCLSSLFNTNSKKIYVPLLTLASVTIAYLYSRDVGRYYEHYKSFAIVIIWLIVESIPIYYGIVAFFRYRHKTAK